MGFFFTIFYQPIYNLFIFLLGSFSGMTVFISAILLVVVCRFVLYVPAKNAWLTQKRIEKIKPDIKKIQEGKGDKRKKGEKTLALYQKNKVNPFSIIFSLLIQIGIILTIFFVINDYTKMSFDEYFLQQNEYSFVSPLESQPDATLFSKNIREDAFILLGILTAISQFLVVRETQKNRKQPVSETSFIKSLNFQMLYLLPVFIMIVSFYLPAIISLYWFINNIFSFFQEKYLQKNYL